MIGPIQASCIVHDPFCAVVVVVVVVVSGEAFPRPTAGVWGGRRMDDGVDFTARVGRRA